MADKYHIVVPVDFSELSLEAVRTAKRFADQSTEITLLYVYDSGGLKSPTATLVLEPHQKGLLQYVEKRLLEDLREVRQTELDNVDQVNLKLCVNTNPAKAICQEAQKLGADMVILTTHGRTGLSHLLLGSVTYDVVRKAPCAVLVLRSDKKKQQG